MIALAIIAERSNSDRSCGNCDNFLRESDVATMDGEPESTWVSRYGVCVAGLQDSSEDDVCAQWLRDECPSAEEHALATETRLAYSGALLA